MDNPKHILRDLALIYIALAHGTDQHLDDTEMDIIARRLQDVQPGVSQGTVLSAVKEALETYTQDDNPQRVEEAAERLRVSVPQSLRRRVLVDLTEIGKADDRFLYAEAKFIGTLVETWKVNLTDLAAGSTAMWSVLDADAGEEWTSIHDLALIYITLAHRTDQSLSREELIAITQKIGEWLPNADEEALRTIVNDVMRVYQDQDGRTFEEAVEAVKRSIPDYQRNAVLDDLRFIAYADGVLLVEERVLIEKLAEAWGCDTSTWAPDVKGEG